jgi:hypothetical protein
MASSRIVSQFGPRLKWHEAKEILTRLKPWNLATFASEILA